MGPRRAVAAPLAVVLSLQPGVLPASAAWFDRSASSPDLPLPTAVAARAPLDGLLAGRVEAGRLRSAGLDLIALAPASRRAEVAAWVRGPLTEATAGLTDSQPVPEPALARLRATLSDLRRAETPAMPLTATPAAVRAAQDAAERRIARLGAPDFGGARAPVPLDPLPDATPKPTATPAAAPSFGDALLSRRSEAGSVAPSSELSDLDRALKRADGALGPSSPAGPSGMDDARDADWAATDALTRLFGAPLGSPAPTGPANPLPPAQSSEIARHTAEIERLNGELTLNLAQRDQAEAMLALAARARDAALAERRSGKDDLEFRKNFSRLAMVMDLSYSLSILNSADQALANMQALVGKKIDGINAQRAANDAAGAAAGAQTGNVAQWTQQAQQAAAADNQQATSFSSLGAGVSKVAAAVSRFASDVPALLAMIDARDRGRSSDAVTEYQRRLALLPSIADQLKNGTTTASSGVSSMSLSYLQAKSREVSGDRALLAGADAKIASVPIEFAGALVVAVPGVPSESVSNPTPDQMLALLGRRRAFWQSQRDEHAQLLASVDAALDPTNAATAPDSFGSPQPVSLARWRTQEQALDASLAAAEAPMLTAADADEAAIEAAGGGAKLDRLSGLSPEDMRAALPRVLDEMESIPLADDDAGFAAKAAHLDLARLICYLGDATARRLEARATAAALDAPVNSILPKAHDAFKTAVAAWQAVLDDESADEAYVRAGAPAAQGQALIDRKRALVDQKIAPALQTLQSLIDDTLIPFQNQRIAQADPTSTGDGYQTLYTQKIALYRQISDGLHLTLPWALASDGAKPYDLGAARTNIASLRATYDKYLGTVNGYIADMARRVDPNDNGTEVVYGETAPYSLVKRVTVYQAEKVARAAAMNRTAGQINDLLAAMDQLDGGKDHLLASWKLPTDLDPNSASTADRLNAIVNGNVLQNMAAAIKAVASAAQAAGGAPSVSVGGGANLPVGNQPPIDVTPMQKLALDGLEVVARLVPSSQTGPAGDSYAQGLARYLFADALVSSSQTYLQTRIPLFQSYLTRAKAALVGAEADLDQDLAWVSGDRSGGDAVLARKATLFAGLSSILSEGAGLFSQKAGWDASGVDSAAKAATYYQGLQSTYSNGDQALDAELSAAKQFQDALAASRAKVDSQRSEVVGWLGQLNSPDESALSRVAQNISTIQDKTRAVLETNVAARQAQKARDQAADAVDATLRALSAERSALDRSLAGVGDLARLGPDLSARVSAASGSGGTWVAEGPSASTLVIPRSQLSAFLGTLLGAASNASGADIAGLRDQILKNPAALAGLIPGSKVIPVGQGPDGFYLVYQTEFSTPGGLETAQSATLGNVAKLWGQNVSLIGYRFESPPSLGNAPYGDQGVTVQVESLDSDHAVNYLDVTFHKFLQDIPDANGVVGQAQEARMMVFDDFALLLADGKVYFGAAGFADVAASGAADKPQYYGGSLKTSVKFSKVLSLNASEMDLFAKDPRKFLQTVNLDFTKYDPTLDQTFVISGSGADKTYRRDQVGFGIDLGQALKESDQFVLDIYAARTAGTDDVNQNSVGATILKGFTFDFLGQKSKLTVGGGAEIGQKTDAFNERISFELTRQQVTISASGKEIGGASAYYLQVSKKLGDHSTAAISYGSPYIGLNDRLAVSFSSSYTLGELWRAVTGQAAEDMTGGKSLAAFDAALADFFTRGAADATTAELRRVFDADAGRRLQALEIGRLTREIETLTRAGALLDNTRQTAMVGFVSNAIGPGTAEQATGGGFQVGTQTQLTLTKTQRALIESKTATLFSLGLEMEERLLDLTKQWQAALAAIALARWRELTAAWLAAHAEDPALQAEARADAAQAADERRQAELSYAALTGRGPDEIPRFDGVTPQDLDALFASVGEALSHQDRLARVLRGAGEALNPPKAGFNVLDWVPWVEKLTFSLGAQLPDVLSSQPIGIGLTLTLPVYDPTRGRRDAAMLLQQRATMLEMAKTLDETRLRAHGERLAAQAWAARAAGAYDEEARLGRELSDAIRRYRNGLVQASDLRAAARRWRDAMSEELEARTQAALEDGWAVLDQGAVRSGGGIVTTEPADMPAAFDQAARTAEDWEAYARRSEAARELLDADDRRVREVTVDLTLGTNLTATGLALLPAFGVTGLGAMPIVGVRLAPEELRQLDAKRDGAEAGLYAKLKDKAQADAALNLTRATVDANLLDREIAVASGELIPGLEAAQDGSAEKARALDEARADLADLRARREQTRAAMNQMLGRPLGAALSFSTDPGLAVAAFAGRAATLDPVGAARDALRSRVAIARAVEAAADKNLKVDQLRLEPISLIGQSLGRLVAALSGDAAGNPELMALARQNTLDAERALEAFDAQVPAVRARLAAQLSAALAARAALAGRDDPASKLQALELERRSEQLSAELIAWGGVAADATDGSLPGSYADLEDRLRRAAESAIVPSGDGADSGAMPASAAVDPTGALRWYDARETLGGDPIGKQFVEGWVEARLRSPSTPPEALAQLARLRVDAADERRRLEVASADARAELLLARLRLGAGLLRWSEGLGLGDAAKARVDGDLAEAAALLHLPPSVRPALLLSLMPAEDGGDLGAVADRALNDASALDLEALSRTLFVDGLPAGLGGSAGGTLPELRVDMIAEKMSSRGFTPMAAFGLFKGQWVSGAFLEAPKPEEVQSALNDVLDDALKRELESQDRLKALGLLLHSLMASVSAKTKLVAAARLREDLARRELRATLERVRLRAAPASEAAAAAGEAQAAQEAFVSALYALREDFARLTTELSALGLKPAPASSGPAPTAASDDPLQRSPRERLLAYWADRMKDADFESSVEALLSDQPDSVKSRLRELAALYRNAEVNDAAVRDNDFTPAERLDLLTKVDLQGRRELIEQVLNGVLDGMQGGDAARSAKWSALMDFLRRDAVAQARARAVGLADADRVREGLRATFVAAMGAPPPVAAEIARLESLQRGVDLAERAALSSWLSRTGAVNDQLAKDRALADYAAALDAFDAEMEKAVESPSVAGDAGWLRALDTLYGVRDSLARRRDRLTHGRGLLVVDAAIELDEARVRALRWSGDDSREMEPAAESLSYLRGLRARWTGGASDPLPALVAYRGADGTETFATTGDLERAKAAGRVATVGGRSFVAPEGGFVAPPTDAADALSRGWREVIVGEDAARERLAKLTAARDAAAREAALTKTLESAPIAVVAGGPLGGGAPERTMTLPQLRELESTGRALWFEGTADPRTGLRAAVPAVAARWRDPGELVLVVLSAGDPPAPGAYPSLESLLASADAARFERARIGAQGLRDLESEAKAAALAARREGWLRLKLNAWGFALDAAGTVQAVYLDEDELRKASTAAADAKDPGHGWTFLRVDQLSLGLAADGTLVAVRAGARSFALGDGTPARWVSVQPLALETDAQGRVTRLFDDRKALETEAAGWSLRDAQGRTWQGGDAVPPILRARGWTDASTGRTVALGRALLQERRDAAKDGASAAAHWGYAPAQWPGLITELPRGIVSTPLEVITGRDPNQQGYLGGVNARRGDGGASVARGALGSVVKAIDLFGLIDDPVDRYFDPSQYPDAVRRGEPIRPGGSVGDGSMRTVDGKKKVFYGVGSFSREAGWASQDLEASRAEVLAAFRGGVRRETLETVRGRAGDWADSSVGLDVGRGAALSAVADLGARLDARGAATVSDSPRRAAVDRVDASVQIVAGADIQDERVAAYEAALKRLAEAPAPGVDDAELARARAELDAALAARRAASLAAKTASPVPNLPGWPVVPQLYASLVR